MKIGKEYLFAGKNVDFGQYWAVWTDNGYRLCKIISSKDDLKSMTAHSPYLSVVMINPETLEELKDERGKPKTGIVNLYDLHEVTGVKKVGKKNKVSGKRDGKKRRPQQKG